jgi:excinuclease ABC subunit A
MVKYSDEQIVDIILEKYQGKKVIILAPKIKGRKGHYKELFEQFRKSGFTKARIDGELVDLVAGLKLDRYKIHDIELVIDRLLIDKKDQKRIYDTVILAMKQGNKSLMVMDYETNEVAHFSRSLDVSRKWY